MIDIVDILSHGNSTHLNLLRNLFFMELVVKSQIIIIKLLIIVLNSINIGNCSDYVTVAVSLKMKQLNLCHIYIDW